jgi:hydrogenase large subunit
LKKIKDFIEKIEGEIALELSYSDDSISSVDISFGPSRKIETILEGKSALDALVITPRVCGICGHAHLISASKAIESAYKASGKEIAISDKAKILREITLSLEMLQSHFKWFYLTLFPTFTKLYNQDKKHNILQGIYPSKILAKAIATIAGQWPHNSYSIAGGVVCDITPNELIDVSSYIHQVREHFKTNLIDIDSDKLLSMSSLDELLACSGDVVEFLSFLDQEDISTLGISHDRFLVLADSLIYQKGIKESSQIDNDISIKYLKESSIDNKSANKVTYNDKHYEVGPLARALVNRFELVESVHATYKDSIYTRVVSRAYEILYLIDKIENLISKIDLSEPSFVRGDALKSITAVGVGSVEASRGTLVHEVSIKDGLIDRYSIITPTQWNLVGSQNGKDGVAQKALIGLKDNSLAEAIFKSFDLCSVCTVQ